MTDNDSRRERDNNRSHHFRAYCNSDATLSMLKAPSAVAIVLCMALAGYSVSRAASMDECSPTARDERLSSIVGAMHGRAPVWLVDGTGDRWQGIEAPVKTVWVVSREARGRLEVTGRRIGADGRLGFRSATDAPLTDLLAIDNPLEWSMRPGGATKEQLRSFAFRASYLIYPMPGCWVITVRIGSDEVHIVRELK